MARVQAIVFDADGMILTGQRFSFYLQQEFGISPDVISRFFNNEFKKCVMGKADLRVELHKYLLMWRWNGSVDDLIAFWFEKEHVVNQQLIEWIHRLKDHRIRCILATNQEKYRLQYLRDNMQLRYVFDEIVASCEVGVTKPHTVFFNKLYSKILPTEKSDVLFWDDKEKNVQAAEKFGFISRQYTNVPDFEHWMKMLVGV